MALEFKFPDLGEGLSEGEVVQWKVKVGDQVADHQALLEVETDKAVVEVPAPAAGFVLSIKGGPGTVIQVGEVIAVIGSEAELKALPVSAPPPPAPARWPRCAGPATRTPWRCSGRAPISPCPSGAR